MCCKCLWFDCVFYILPHYPFYSQHLTYIKQQSLDNICWAGVKSDPLQVTTRHKWLSLIIRKGPCICRCLQYDFVLYISHHDPFTSRHQPDEQQQGELVGALCTSSSLAKGVFHIYWEGACKCLWEYMNKLHPFDFSQTCACHSPCFDFL